MWPSLVQRLLAISVLFKVRWNHHSVSGHRGPVNPRNSPHRPFSHWGLIPYRTSTQVLTAISNLRSTVIWPLLELNPGAEHRKLPQIHQNVCLLMSLPSPKGKMLPGLNMKLCSSPWYFPLILTYFLNYFHSYWASETDPLKDSRFPFLSATVCHSWGNEHAMAKHEENMSHL